MMIPEWVSLLVMLGSPLWAAGGAYAAVRVHLQYLRRDIDTAASIANDAHRRINELAISTRRLLALGR